MCRLTKEVRAHVQSMGETGNGIMSAAEVDFERDNEFTNLTCMFSDLTVVSLLKYECRKDPG